MTALALREDQTAWDSGQLAVLHGSGIDKDVSGPELTAFLHECQRRRLDPFTRQIYLIGRYSKKERRKVYRSQTSIDGFRLIARRAADAAKETIEYEETTWYDAAAKGHEVWLDRSLPSGCKVVVLRGGKRFPVVARFAAYVQTDSDGSPTQMWLKMPDIMIAKCAEALALRMAFPEELGGIYTDDEMAQADNPQQHVRAVSVEVVRDEPAAAEDANAAAAEAWMTAATENAATFADDNAGRKLWAEVVTRKNRQAITAADADRLKELIKARWAELTAKSVEGTVVDALDPADPWAQKIEEIASADDAAAVQQEALRAFGDKSVSDTKTRAVMAAIAVKAATFEPVARAA
jgi:phage recombination protein Bet